MFFNHSHRTTLDSVEILPGEKRSITETHITLLVSGQHTGQSRKKHRTLYLDCGTSLAAHWAGHLQRGTAAEGQAELSAH